MNAEPRPGAAPVAGCYQIDDLTIDTRVRRVTRGGIDLKVTNLSFDLLLALVRASPNLVTSDMLMAHVWPGIVVSPETLTQRVKLLRQALGDNADSPRYILAVRGHGYRMLAVAALADGIRSIQPAPAPSVNSNGAGEGHSLTAPIVSGGVPRRWLIPAMTLMLLIVAGGVWWRLEQARLAESPYGSGGATAGTGGTIAVMPFANLTGDPAKEYLGDGMADELTEALSRVPGIKVTARTATSAYRGRSIDIARIAQDLGIATILEGDVRSVGERIRVSTRLLDVRSGAPIWSQNYDRPFADLFKLQDDLAADVTQALHAYLGTILPTPPVREPPTRDLEAYRLYLQARAVSRGSPETELQALGLVNQALARDPNFALALAYRATIPTGAAALGFPVPPAVLAQAEQDARRALTLVPSLADAQATLGVVSAVRGNWVEAERAYRAALAAAPNDLVIRGMYSLVVLRPAGRVQQALSVLSESYRISPADGFTIHELALTNSLLGLDSEALRFVRLHDELGGGGQAVGNDLVYTRAAARNSRYGEAAKRAANVLPAGIDRVDGVRLVDILYGALADPTKKAAARRAFESELPNLESNAIDGQVRGFFLQALTMLGALDSAYALANRSVDEGASSGMFGSRIYIADFWLPEMRPLRQDLRFQALVTRLKFMEYWKQFGPPDECDLKDGMLTCH